MRREPIDCFVRYHHFVLFADIFLSTLKFSTLCSLFLTQQKLKSTAIVTACSIGAFVGIGVYKNNEVFYDRYLMPTVQICSPELSHRLAVLGFKYKLFPRQKECDSERLVICFCLCCCIVTLKFLCD